MARSPTTPSPALSAYFKLHRRYGRSVNLERDLDNPEAVQGYVPTDRAGDALWRILSAIGQSEHQRAWTITGVYGTGKSAFAHYLAALCAPKKSKLHQTAIAIAQTSFLSDSRNWQAMIANLPAQGLVRAVATGRQEPLAWTIARALIRGSDSFWAKKQQPEFLRKLADWRVELETGNAEITDQSVLQVLHNLAKAAKTSILLVIDELGKNLEFASHHQSVSDLYLLQQIAELAGNGEYPVYFLGILHQSFAGYSDRLTAVEQNDWNKIQGRFADILFTDSASQLTRLIGQAIDRTDADPLLDTIQAQAERWVETLQPILSDQDLSPALLANAYPLHPLAALVLPLLCVRYAQNDRSLFTFLTSDEPYALPAFLGSTLLVGKQLPTLKLYQLYDYFVESMTGLASRSNLQRWVEIRELIQDAGNQSPDVVKVLKTIGLLNLITTTSNLRAIPQLVTLALNDRPDDKKQSRHWQQIIKDLQPKGLLTHRRQLDELRIWQGSDFDIEAAITDILEKQPVALVDLLATTHPLKPLVAQRHYTTTGTLRYFEQRYLDSRTDLTQVACRHHSSDGLLVYWLDEATELVSDEINKAERQDPRILEGAGDLQFPTSVPSQTVDGKPLILMQVNQLALLRTRAQELYALQKILRTAPELQQDKIARKEVRHRWVEADRLLDETVAQVLHHVGGQCPVWIGGQPQVITSARAFQSALSDLCDRTYPQGLRLDNELINRRELTSQGAKARRELIEAMLERQDQERLGLRGYGPEVAMYYSLLQATGIHRQEEGELGFYPPPETSGVFTVWQAIVQFCLAASQQQRSLANLYSLLQQPPYGVKAGVIPLLLVAVLLYHLDDVSLYKDGTFLPILSSEQFELLVKAPGRFSVKYIELTGLRSQVFRELEAILRDSPAQSKSRRRNQTLLSVVKPLVSFVRKLPAYTLKTKRLSTTAQAVLQALQQTQEPDTLLFIALPQACGLEQIVPHRPHADHTDADHADTDKTARAFRESLVQQLREIHTTYDRLLTDSETLLYNAFGLRSQRDQLRPDLQFRARYLLGNCAESNLDRFVRAAANETAGDRSWLEALLMIVADKPANAWSDADATLFEMKLGDLARRFKNLESLQKEVAAHGSSGFEARRITVTRPDGEEVHQMVWISHEQQTVVDPLIDELLENCDDRQLQQALLARLSDRVLGEAVDQTASPRKMTPKSAKMST